jgi:ribose 5-phosphate isomerase B
VATDAGSLGVVLGGSGNGEQIAANKVAGIRAALAWSVDTARLAREHNDAQVVAVGARMHSFEEVHQLVATFVRTPFGGEQRHARRLAMIDQYEQTGEMPSAHAER